MWLCPFRLFVSFCLIVSFRFVCQKKNTVTSRDIVRRSWQNSTPILGAAAFCTTKIGNFRASLTFTSLTTWSTHSSERWSLKWTSSKRQIMVVFEMDQLVLIIRLRQKCTKLSKSCAIVLSTWKCEPTVQVGVCRTGKIFPHCKGNSQVRERLLDNLFQHLPLSDHQFPQWKRKRF